MGDRTVDQGGLFDTALAERGASLSPAARRVVGFIDTNRAATLASSALELAAPIHGSIG